MLILTPQLPVLKRNEFKTYVNDNFALWLTSSIHRTRRILIFKKVYNKHFFGATH